MVLAEISGGLNLGLAAAKDKTKRRKPWTPPTPKGAQPEPGGWPPKGF